MTALARLQRGFQRHILEGHARFEREVANTARVAAERRLAIYSSAYRARIIEALGDDYPGLRALAGETLFERLAREYVDANPSRFFNLRWYGSGLAAFLRSFAGRRAPGFCEMADFEWQLGLAFDAADAAPVMIEDIARVPPDKWPGMRLAAHPSVRLLSLRYNVPALSSAVQDGKPMPPLRRKRSAVCWLIWRRDLTVHFRSLARDEAQALNALTRGASFSQICATLSDSTDPALRAAALLKGWAGDGLIARSPGHAR